MTNVAKTLQSAVQGASDEVAIDDGDVPIGQSTLWSLVDQFAGGLRSRDVTEGDAVGIRLSSPVEFLVAVYGSLRNGSVPVTIPDEFDDVAIADALDAVEAPLLVTDRRPISILSMSSPLRVLVTYETDAPLGVEFDAFLDSGGLNPANSRTGIDVFRRADEDTALIAYVDERQGDPIATTYTHGAVQAAADAGAEISTPATEAVDRHLGAYPLDRPLGLLYGATATIFAGGRYRPLAPWDPREARNELYGGAFDRAYLSPEQYEELRAVADDGVDDAALVVDPTPSAPGAEPGDVTRLCGTPETGITHVRSPADVEAGGIGTPVGDVDVTVLGDDGGELAVASNATMAGYYDRPELTGSTVERRGDGRWIRTGARVRA